MDEQEASGQDSQGQLGAWETILKSMEVLPGKWRGGRESEQAGESLEHSEESKSRCSQRPY